MSLIELNSVIEAKNLIIIKEGRNYYSLKTYRVIDIQSAISTLEINNLTFFLIIKININFDGTN